MAIVHERNPVKAEPVDVAQDHDCDTANHPSAVDIERMLRADRTRSTHFGGVASSLAAAWREATR